MPKPSFFATFLLSALCLTGCFGRTQTTPRPTMCHNLSRSITAAQNWLIHGQSQRPDPSGLYAYIYDPLNDTYPEQDNIVRQLGTLWAMVATLDRAEHRAQALQSINRFRTAVQSFVEHEIIEGEKIAFLNVDGIAKLNASALYVLAYATMLEQGIALNRNEIDQLTWFVRGIQTMAAGDGRYYYIYFLPNENNKISSYGTSEAYFALQKFANVTHNQKIHDYTAQQFELFFTNHIRDATDLTSDEMKGYLSWGLYALAARPIFTSEDYSRYLKPVLVKLLHHSRANPETRASDCIFIDSALDAPFAEGLAAVLPLIRRHDPAPQFIAAIEDQLHNAIAVLRTYQILSVNDYETNAGLPFTGDPARILGGFCNDRACTLMRNDNTQHIMMAIEGYSDSHCRTGDRPAR